MHFVFVAPFSSGLRSFRLSSFVLFNYSLHNLEQGLWPRPNITTRSGFAQSVLKFVRMGSANCA